MKRAVQQTMALLADPGRFFSGREDRFLHGNLLRDGVLTVLAAALGGTAALLLLQGSSGPPARFVLMVAGALLFAGGLISALVKAGLFHLLAGFRGRQGDPRLVLGSQLLSFTPFLFLLPVALILRALRLEGLFFFFYLYLLFRSYGIELAGVRAAYSFERRRGVLLVSLPVAIQAGFCILAVVGVLVMTVGLLLYGSGLV